MLFLPHKYYPTLGSIIEREPRAIHIERAPGGWYIFTSTEAYGRWLDSYHNTKSANITQKSGMQS